MSGITPYEAWFGEKPQVGHVRVFGSVAYMKLPSINIKKLKDRRKTVVNLGKEPGTKAYRLYDPETKKVLVSSDVVFDEEKSWLWSEERNETEAGLKPFTVVDYDVTEPVEIHSGKENNLTGSRENSNETGNSEVTDSRNTDSETDSEPHHFKSLRDIYSNTKYLEIEDEELLLMGWTNQPTTNKQQKK